MTASHDVALGEICDVRIGRTPRRDTRRFWEHGKHPWVTIGEMNGDTIVTTKESISDAAIAEIMPPPVAAGTILFSFKLSIGKTAVAGRPLWTNEAIAALPIRRPDLVDRNYLKAFLAAGRWENGANHAVLGRVLNKEKLLNLPIRLSSLDEQRRIVDILDRAASIRRLRRQAQETARQIIPALFVKMFGDPATNPMGWPVRPLGQILADGPQNGLYRPASDYGRGTRILRIDSFYDGKVDDLGALRRVELDPVTIQKYQLRPRDIVVNRVNSRPYLGKSAILPVTDEAVVFESNMMRLTIDTAQALPEYVIAYLQTPHARHSLVVGAKDAINQSSINQQDVTALPVPLPSLPAQADFVERGATLARIGARQAAAHSIADHAAQALQSRLFG